ncbi:hypothetical protein LCGC14_2413880 [marine sediment metagenome]|uniref:Uncharacterized protein n=1 Tax=marine sediment metagenome TaxID=412755 RepID=A0A0F9BRQ5_9ZZZZ
MNDKENIERYCSYCKKQTFHEIRKSDFFCIDCGSTDINIQGFHMDLM